MTNVFGFALGVQPALGPVLGDEELPPPHAITSAAAQASAAPAHILSFGIQVSPAKR